MRSARQIIPDNDDEAWVHIFDLRDIDASNPYDVWRLTYLERIHAILRVVRDHCQPGARILDIGAAQGNISLLLAESGYDVTATDLRKGFLDYSQKKYERGLMRWICGNAFELSFEEQFAAVILGEIVEHVAHPDDLIARALTLVASGGILVVTTPNQQCLIEHTPTYETACKDVVRMEAEQFGPAGEHHLFTLTMRELRLMVPPNGVVVQESFVHSMLYSHYIQSLWNNAIARSLLLALTYRLRIVPAVRRLVNSGLIIVVEKQCDTGPVSSTVAPYAPAGSSAEGHRHSAGQAAAIRPR